MFSALKYEAILRVSRNSCYWFLCSSPEGFEATVGWWQVIHFSLSGASMPLGLVWIQGSSSQIEGSNRKLPPPFLVQFPEGTDFFAVHILPPLKERKVTEGLDLLLPWHRGGRQKRSRPISPKLLQDFTRV